MALRKLRVSFAPVARAELIARAAYYQRQASERVSDRFVEAVAQTVDLLTRMPKIGRLYLPPAKARPETRRISLISPFHGVTLFYSATERELRVERLLHSAQDLQNLFP